MMLRRGHGSLMEGEADLMSLYTTRQSDDHIVL